MSRVIENQHMHNNGTHEANPHIQSNHPLISTINPIISQQYFIPASNQRIIRQPIFINRENRSIINAHQRSPLTPEKNKTQSRVQFVSMNLRRQSPPKESQFQGQIPLRNHSANQSSVPVGNFNYQQHRIHSQQNPNFQTVRPDSRLIIFPPHLNINQPNSNLNFNFVPPQTINSHPNNFDHQQGAQINMPIRQVRNQPQNQAIQHLRATVHQKNEDSQMERYEALRWQNKYEDLKQKYDKLIPQIQNNTVMEDNWMLEQQNRLLREKVKVLENRDEHYYTESKIKIQQMIEYHRQATIKECQLLMDRFRLQSKLKEKRG